MKVPKLTALSKSILEEISYDIATYEAMRRYKLYALRYNKTSNSIKKLVNRKTSVPVVKEVLKRLRPHDWKRLLALFSDLTKRKFRDFGNRPWHVGVVVADKKHDKQCVSDEREINMLLPNKKVPMEEIFDLCRKHKQLNHEISPVNRKIELFIPTSKPIGIVLSSDWHLGNLGVDIDRFENDLRFVKENQEYLRMIVVGDLIENCVSFPSAEAILSEQGLSPKEQRHLLECILDNLSGIILAGWFGNHDVGRDLKLIGDSFVRKMFLLRNIPFLGGIGKVELSIGNCKEEAEVYKALIAHKPKGRSIYNKLHGSIRFHRELAPESDFIVTAHLHRPAYQVDTEYDRKRILIALGTYNVDAAYAIRAYGGGGAVGAPTLVLWPDCHRMEIFACAEDAVRFMKTFEE